MWVKNVTNGRTNGRTNGQGVSRRRIYKYFLFFKHLNIFRNSVSHAINLHCSHILMRICCITRSLREFTFGWMWSNLNSIQHYQDWVLPLCDLTETLKLITFLGSFQKPFFFSISLENLLFKVISDGCSTVVLYVRRVGWDCITALAGRLVLKINLRIGSVLTVTNFSKTNSCHTIQKHFIIEETSYIYN